MTKLSKLIGNFIKAADLPANGQGRKFKIASLVREELSGEEKFIMAFDNTAKRLVMNKTNLEALIEVAGDLDVEDYVGHEITLIRGTTYFQGKETDCIRIKVPRRKPAADEEIPF